MRFGFHAALRLCVPALLLSLAGCGPGRNEFAPLCPTARLERDLADLNRFAGTGSGHDLTDLVLQASITKVDGSCQPTDAKTRLGATVRITISVLRGPAMRGREADVPVFVAVARGDTVRDKQLIPVHLVFPPNVDRLTLTSQPIDMALPVNQDVNGASYVVIAGFQLSPDELSANRQAKGG